MQIVIDSHDDVHLGPLVAVEAFESASVDVRFAIQSCTPSALLRVGLENSASRQSDDIESPHHAQVLVLKKVAMKHANALHGLHNLDSDGFL